MNSSQNPRSTEERRQSVTRISISISTFVLLASFNLLRVGHLNRTLAIGLGVILIHTIFSLVWHRFVLTRPTAWPPRIYVAMVMDITATSLAFFFAARFGSFFYPVFLWVIVGYGLRYGKRALLATVLLAFVEFGLVLNHNVYWQENGFTGLGMWWGILLLPGFFLSVLNRLGSLNQQLQAELINSKTAERAKGEFLANMSHEIRTPLNGVLGMAQILEDADIDPENRRHLDVLRHAAGSLLDLVNDILDFSKITAGKVTLESVPFDLLAVLDDVVQILQPAAAAKELTLGRRYPATTPGGFRGDPVRIRQIIMNLAANSVKFTETGSIDLEISVDEDPDGTGHITLTVADTGVGISQDHLPHVFEQFEQGDTATTRTFGGTGLGLAISRHLAQAMGGDIRVESEPGRGSIFTVDLRLPFAAIEPEPVRKGTDLPRFDLQVLVAEDNNVNQLVIRRLLKKLGIDAVFAANGREAIAELERRRFDLVFMDVRMPVMDGIEATRVIRSRPEPWADLPIIALTANADSDSAQCCLDAGMNLHLGKPVILAQVVAAIESLSMPVGT